MNNPFALLFRSADRRRAYAQLAQLDDHLLRDIGVNRSELRSLVNSRLKAPRTHG